jgi:hypothetical protein
LEDNFGFEVGEETHNQGEDRVCVEAAEETPNEVLTEAGQSKEWEKNKGKEKDQCTQVGSKNKGKEDIGSKPKKKRGRPTKQRQNLNEVVFEDKVLLEQINTSENGQSSIARDGGLSDDEEYNNDVLVAMKVMITKYWRTIGHTNICSSVQDHRIYPSSIIKQIWKHQKYKRSSKTLVEDMKKGQPKINTLDQKKRTPLQKLKRSSDSV